MGIWDFYYVPQKKEGIILFSEATAKYLEDREKRLRKNTIEGYVCTLNKHVLSAFGDKNIEDITNQEVQNWVDNIPTYGAARKAYKTFRQVYRWIMKKEQMQIWDVTQSIELPKEPIKKKETLTAKQEVKMLQGIIGQDWEPVILMAAACGLRRCEACGLDWSDFDWRGGWVHIQRGAHYINGQLIEYPTKTKLSDRTLKVPHFALVRLRKIRGNKKKGRLRGDLKPHQIANRYKNYCRKHDLPFVPMTSLRHSWATIALEQGASIEDISVALGHSSIDTCVQHYLQSFKTVVKRAATAYTNAIEL